MRYTFITRLSWWGHFQKPVCFFSFFAKVLKPGSSLCLYPLGIFPQTNGSNPPTNLLKIHLSANTEYRALSGVVMILVKIPTGQFFSNWFLYPLIFFSIRGPQRIRCCSKARLRQNVHGIPIRFVQVSLFKTPR